jgi:putative transposase
MRGQGPWRDVDHVEIETLNWIDWFNTERPHEFLDNLTPARIEDFHLAHQHALAIAG